MPAEFDPEKFRPDDLELEPLYDQYPEFRPLWVKYCQANAARYTLSGRAGFRAPEHGYQSDVPSVPTTEHTAVRDRFDRACQAIEQFCKQKGVACPSLR